MEPGQGVINDLLEMEEEERDPDYVPSPSSSPRKSDRLKVVFTKSDRLKVVFTKSRQTKVNCL